MTFEKFMKTPMKTGFYRGMLRISYAGIKGKKEAIQTLNGFMGAWIAEYNPTLQEVSVAREYIHKFFK